MDKKIIVFDLHNVILQFDFWKALKQCIRLNNKFFLLTICLNPRFIIACTRLYRKTRVGEEFILSLCEKFPAFQKFMEFCFELCNCQKPIVTMQPLITLLKQEGYTLGIFSNIGEYTFTKLKQQYPHIFVHFDIIHTTSKKDYWMQKPHKKAYEYFLQKYNINPDMMIFIDDKKKNVKAAQACGISSVHFKSSMQVYYDLMNLIKMRIK